MGTVRIVGGILRGRRVRVPDTGARPTGEKVREALFDILGPTLDGGRALDAYAGSGALGFEALSRGADEAVFLEADARAVERLRENAVRLGVADRCRVLRGDAAERIRSGAAPPDFRWIFADPPWSDERGPDFLGAVVRGRILAPGGIVVLERETARAVTPAPPGMRHEQTRTYGRSSLDFYISAS